MNVSHDCVTRRGLVQYRLLVLGAAVKWPTALIILSTRISKTLCHTAQGYYSSEEICSRRVSESGLKKVLLLREGATWHSFHAKHRFVSRTVVGRRLYGLSNHHHKFTGNTRPLEICSINELYYDRCWPDGRDAGAQTGF